mmetsp:Transcript_21781/g.33077  ORF Transcript_21781/g.33077 Transcript_21781/m.33077 type:complete len:146 (+) Transcript_21781:124-561(+)
MHSRRPPTLRHKGNRKEMTQHQQKNPQDEKSRNGKTKNGIKLGASSSSKSRKSNGFPVRIFLSLIFLLILGLYVKFMISNTTISIGHNKVGNLRNKNGASSQEKDSAASNDNDEKLRDTSKADAKDEEEEERAWKNVVKEQSTTK